MTSPRQSLGVLLCTYNGARYLTAQLDSLMRQSRLPDELWVADDGSTDETVAIVERHPIRAKVDVGVVRRRQTHGPAGNFLTGLAEMRSDWVAFCDQDDIWFEHKLERFAQEIAAREGVDLLFSNALLIDEHDRVIPGTDLWRSLGFVGQTLADFARLPASVLCRRPVVTGMCTAVNRLAAIAVGPAPACMMHDEWLAYQLCIHGRVEHIPEHTAYYRIHAAQALGLGLRMKRGRLSLLRQQLETRIPAPVDFLEKSRVLLAAVEGQPGFEAQARFLGERTRHLEARCRIQPASVAGLRQVWEELSRGRYHRFSGGAGAAIKDLLRLVWGR